MRKLLVCLALLSWLTACATNGTTGNPIGGGTDDYERSRCACQPIPQPNYG